MAFSIRKMISNITTFKQDKRQEEDPTVKRRHTIVSDENFCINFEEPDSTSRQTGLSVPQSVINFAAKKGSLSDTDVLAIGESKSGRRKCKKLKLDIKQARSMTEPIGSSYEDSNIENTPKHVLLECQSSGMFSDRLKCFDFNQSFDINDAMSDDQPSSPFEEENYEIKSITESDSDVSADCGKSSIKMCRKVDMNESLSSHEDHPKSSPTESFGEVERDSNEEERSKIINTYQMKLEKINCIYKTFLNDLQFQIDFAKLFNTRSVVTLPNDVSSIPRTLGEIAYLDNISRGPSPTGSWNVIMEKEDEEAKTKFKKQLQSMKRSLEFFIREHLKNYPNDGKNKIKKQFREKRSITFDIHKGQRVIKKRTKVTPKKLIKYLDFPDLREAMLNLFTLEPDRDDTSVSGSNVTALLSDSEDLQARNCNCNCHSTSSSQTDSALANKTDHSISSITSSLNNFSLDSSTLTAYSESLDQIVSYNSFQDTSLYSTMLQKAAIERITFYIQVHSIQLQCEPSDQEFESKNIITFHCPSCKITETEENGLLKHILSQAHCEKIHFQYKTAYIKRCVAAGKEIQPSTILNPMKLYRDVNKIVCFGDTLYACSLCFENLIMGESILMAHCSDPEHLERRARLCEIIDYN